MFVGNSDFSIQDFVEQAKLNTQEFWIESSGIMSALKKAAGKNTESIEYKIFSTVFHMGIVSGIST